jgi:tetratricopeptide (TPR) repeat protein
MARLVRKYVWPFIDQSGEKKQRLLATVIKFYDQLIEERAGDKDAQNTLRIEQLYYMFESGHLEDGKRMWFNLAESDDDYINSVLPGEIKEYKTQFDPETRYEIHSRIAKIEFDANHMTQARGEWMQVRKLGEQEGRDEWVAAALFGHANCEGDANSALNEFQEAGKFCEKNVTEYLPRVYYNIGFTYRRMQDIDKAIDWYKKAQEAFQKNPWDDRLGAQIANDLGYAYSQVGMWTECKENVMDGRDIRQRPRQPRHRRALAPD